MLTGQLVEPAILSVTFWLPWSTSGGCACSAGPPTRERQTWQSSCAKCVS